jgi:cell division protein FtsX
MSAVHDAGEPSLMTSRGPRPRRAVVATALVVVAVACVSVWLVLNAMHGHRRESTSKVPRSVAVDAFPSSSSDPTVNRRKIEVFIKASATPTQISALEAKIKALPQVEIYAYISKDEALQQFTKKYGTAITSQIGLNPMPASFEMLVRDPRTEQAVAERFFNDPIVDNSPGQHDGVVYQTSQVP